jgi:ABC-type Fe3+ transport system substrate-binding protein
VFKINDAAVPFTAVATSIGVNTKLLTPAQYPKTWIDLGNPMYKGKISAGRPDKSGSAFIQLALHPADLRRRQGLGHLQQDPGQHRAVQQLGRSVQVCQ